MDKIDKQIFSMAQSEQIRMPSGYENRINGLLANLPRENENPPVFTKILAMVAGLVVVVSLSFCGYIVIAGDSDAQKVTIEESEIDNMYVIKVKQIHAEKDENGFIEYKWESYNAMQEGLGISLLRSDDEFSGEIMEINDKTDNEDYHMIYIDNFAYVENGKNSTLLDLEISIRCSTAQSSKGLITEYLGNYQRRGEYVSKQGYQVIFVGNQIFPWQTLDDDTVNGELISIFVADGILYQFSGKVSINQMKEIIDLLHY